MQLCQDIFIQNLLLPTWLAPTGLCLSRLGACSVVCMQACVRVCMLLCVYFLYRQLLCGFMSERQRKRDLFMTNSAPVERRHHCLPSGSPLV